MDREAWRAAIHGVAKSQTRLSDWTELNAKLFIKYASGNKNKYINKAFSLEHLVCEFQSTIISLYCIVTTFCLFTQWTKKEARIHFPHFCIYWYSVAKSCLTLCDPMDGSAPGFPVLHCLPELAQTHVHWVSDAIQPEMVGWDSSVTIFFASIRVFPSETVLHIKWPKYWSFSISPSNEYSVLISFRIDWFVLLAVQGTPKSLIQHHSTKASILLYTPYWKDSWTDHGLDKHLRTCMFSFSSVAQSCLTLCDPMNCSTPGFPVHHQLPELAQTHVHWVSDAI